MFIYSDLRRQKLKILLTYVAAASLGICAFMGLPEWGEPYMAVVQEHT